MSSKRTLVSKKEYKTLKEDKLRVDYLQKVAERGRMKILGHNIDLPPISPPYNSIRHLIDIFRLNDIDF